MTLFRFFYSAELITIACRLGTLMLLNQIQVHWTALNHYPMHTPARRLLIAESSQLHPAHI